jgi:beta-mannosidase
VERFSQGNYNEEADGWLEQDLPAHWQQHPALECHTGAVVYRRRFQWPGQSGVEGRVWLRCNGIFYWSSVYLNGQHLGDHEGYFAAQEYEITSLVRTGENEIVIEVYCPKEAYQHNKRMITGVFSHWNVGDMLNNPGGIWLPVEVYTAGPAKFNQVLLHTEEISSEAATLHCRLEVDTAHRGDALLRFTFTPESFEGAPTILEEAINLQGETQTWTGTLVLPHPRLWWTHDLGHPNLYRVMIACVQQGTVLGEREFLLGVRTFELRDWIPYLNGVRFFIRGSNYAPGDMRIARMDQAGYARDVELAKQAHMNMLRLHAHIEHPAFYEVADREGILVWQDFPLQWSYDREALPAAKQQAAEMVELLYNHPSVVVWCMHNEPIWQEVQGYHNSYFVWRINWSTIKYIWNRFIYSWDREVLDSQLKRVVRHLDPSRPAVRASGEIALPLFRRGTDTHFYFGWYAAYGPKRSFELVRRFFKRNLRFVTEFGAQSFPNEENLRRFLPSDLKQVDWEEVTRRYAFQPKVMALWLDWRNCQTWQELIELSQQYQSELNRYYIDRLRFHKYRPTGGIVTFNLTDPCPAVQWSVVDYWREPKKSYAALKTAFHPQYVFTLLDRDQYRIEQTVRVPIYVVNDAQSGLAQARVIAEICDEKGQCLLRQKWSQDLPGDSLAIQVGRLRFRPKKAGLYRVCLRLEWNGDTLENSYPFFVQE